MSTCSEQGLPPLAIVGISLKFPGDAVTPDDFWKMLLEGRAAASEFPPDRVNIDALYHPDRERLDQLSTRGANFMKGDLGAFDAGFFTINTTEAEAMDPQQRLILEASYRALENAGITMAEASGSKTCVFTGSFSHDYNILQVKDPMTLPKWHATGTSMNMLSNRVSWFFNLQGPSATVDTACSSSLMAIDLACQSIWTGNSSMGLAIGSNTILALEMSLCLDNLGLLSKDGRSFSFDQRGNGYARGEGVGVLVIRPLEEAIRHGDTIRAVIRSTSSNQDGRTPGIMQPSGTMQEKLIRDTYVRGGLDLATTRYFEAHGTGTAVGDPIEARAIGSIFRDYRSADDPLYIGSVKSSIGHLEGASGVAGVIKVVLALEKGIIPPSAGLEKLNHRIDDEFLHIKVPQTPVAWPVDGLRRASVSSFGFGGSNIHIVIDDALNYLQINGLQGNHNTTARLSTMCVESHHTNGTLDTTAEEAKLLVWSAADENGISRIQDKWRSFFSSLHSTDKEKKEYLSNLAYTLANRRSHHLWRTFATVKCSDDWSVIVDKFARPCRSISSPNLAFVFTGQGAQWYAMGRELISGYSVFRDSVKAANRYLQTLGCQWDLLEELQKPEESSNVNKTEYSQPLCTALQVGLVDLLSHFKISPKVVVGHSAGEIAAAYCASAIDRHSAWKIAFYRGKWSSQLEKSSYVKGSMIAVALSPKDVEPYLEKIAGECEILRLTVACINSPKSVTISGEEMQIDMLKSALSAENVFCRKLKVKVAYHSFQMHEIAAQYQSAMGELEKGTEHKTSIEMVSSVTGTWIKPEDLRAPEYWVQNMVSPVKFSDALFNLCSNTETPRRKIDRSHRRAYPIHHLVELGPHSALQAPIKENLSSLNRQSVTYHSLLVRGVPATDTVMTAAGYLHAAGYSIDLGAVNNLESLEEEGLLKSIPDLPEYPFNHSKSYWHESQISRNHRLPKIGRNDLLGTPDPNWNPLEPRWRNIIKLSEMPWVRDHQINGTILYPAAGMVVMAVEAAKQLAIAGRQISSFNIKDVTLHAAIPIQEQNETVETAFHMRPVKALTSAASHWYEFALYMNTDSSWVSNCTGTIQVAYHPEKPDPVDCRHIERDLVNQQIDAYLQASKECTSPTEVEALYSHLKACGYEYGDAFQGITALSVNPSDYTCVTGEVSNRPSISYETIHPTALDALIQTALWPTTRCGAEVIPTAVPTHIESIALSVDGLSTTKDLFKVHTRVEPSGNSDICANITAFDDKLGKAIVTVDGLRCTAVNELAIAETHNSTDDKLCHRVEWKPDIRLLKNDDINEICRPPGVDTSALEEFFIEVDFLLLARLLEALDVLAERSLCPSNLQVKKYLEWAATQKRLLCDGQLVFSSEPWKSRFHDIEYIQTLDTQLYESNPQGKFLVSFSRNLTKFLCEELDPLEFIFTCGLIDDFYYDTLDRSSSSRRITAYLELLVHANPQMRILEIGAGTGSATRIFLRTLGRGQDDSQTSRYAHWEYTDISRSFFGEAASQFAAEGDRMRFNTLDIEHDPQQQGFECGTYDIVVASLVIHATSDLTKTLTHVRKLLKPGGKLIMNEMTNPARSAYVFGLLEGWWLGCESYRSLGPCVGERQWHELLSQTGFSGCDLVFPDVENATCQENAFIIATASEDTPEAARGHHIQIVHDPTDCLQTELARRLEEGCRELTGSTVECVSLEETGSSDDLLRVFLLEYSKPVLCDMQEEVYTRLQALLLSTKNTLWVTEGGGKDFGRPHLHLIEGLFRVLSEEDGGRDRYIISLERQQTERHPHHRLVLDLISHILSPVSSVIDSDYKEHQGVLQVGRMVNHHPLNNAISVQTNPQQAITRPFGCGTQLRLDASSSSMTNGFRFIEAEWGDQPLAANEVELEVSYVGVNFRDVLIALGQLNVGGIGLECSGTITRVGTACRKFRTGDKVVGFLPNCYSTHLRFRETDPVVHIPQGVSLPAAAAVPANFITAYMGLKELARIQPGESVLVHSGAGGTGQAAIQIAKHFGAQVYTTVGSESKKKFLMQTYGIPESHIYSSRSTFFSQAILQQTAGKGVDIVFNSLSGESLIKSWECIAPYGRFIEIGKKDILSNSKLPMIQFAKNTTFISLDLGSWARDRPAACVSALAEILALLVEGKFQPPSPIATYGVCELEKAFRLMQGGKHHGKLVIEMRRDDPVMTVLKPKPISFFDPNATYVISGGLGGLGQNAVNWLVSRGARNLLLLSRSGGDSPEGRKLLDQLHSQGVEAMAPACNVSDAQSLRKVLDACQSHLPPIKGCIQGAMVLHDVSYEDMSYTAWQTAVNPKVQGSWNLHELLPKGMDFFILLSSINGLIGSRGQANYAAGNTFQDALAHYRVSIGERATSFDLGLFTFAGAVAKDPRLREMMRNNSVLEPVTEAQFHALLDTYCNPDVARDLGLSCQTAIGVHPVAMERGAGRAYWLEKPLFGLLQLDQASEGDQQGQVRGVNIAAALQSATSLAEATTLTAEALTLKLCRVLSLSESDIDENKALHEYGVDSLVAVELRSWFSKEMQADVAVFDIMGRATVTSLAQLAVGRSKLEKGWSV
ncbi:polyketide synthase [Aspergillus arachidicola]|uniref:Polyketide synthase n=1 Tax=Aspergillus arachidicola TaxID=656916 RepID=A0A2G7EN52_9EURO|nr:polyketide synthase [Aspergillus arachidicola]